MSRRQSADIVDLDHNLRNVYEDTALLRVYDTLSDGTKVCTVEKLCNTMDNTHRLGTFGQRRRELSMLHRRCILAVWSSWSGE